VYRRVGWKFGAWHDVGWWELDLRPEGEPPRLLTPFSELSWPVATADGKDRPPRS
jgi:phosphinothricin acetyltransferase